MIKCYKDKLELNLYNPLSYLRDELEAATRLIRERNSIKSEFLRGIATLDEKKEGIIIRGDFKEVELDSLSQTFGFTLRNISEMSNDDKNIRSLMKYFMFPNKRKVIHEMRKGFGYFNHMLLSQVPNIGRSFVRRLSETHSELCLEMKKTNEDHAGAWGAILEKSGKLMTLSSNV